MSTELILGTAGHIDHGKTTLIKCLTGTDTDRLPEEKKRGITIELGFAELVLGDFRIGIVDVPGHEKFVRQMLAGATGMDLALLVIAADDSVKPQTREHLDVLRLLDLKAGVIALTKCDAADPDWISLVEDEVRELVADTFLESAPIIRTSSLQGDGIDALKEALSQAAETVADVTETRRQMPFRMAIDRVFSLTGHGTVVTGSVVSGKIAVGETVAVEPGSSAARIRGLHNHDREVQEVMAGQRAAINLAGVHHDELDRGFELAAPGFLSASRLVNVQLQMLPNALRPLKRRDRVRIHLGTAEVLASVVPLDRDSVGPGESTFAQLFLREAVVSTWNQPFVVRSESPVMTIAGGRVLVPNAQVLRHPTDVDLEQLSHLTSNDEIRRAGGAVYFNALSAGGPEQLHRAAGIDRPDEVYEQLVENGDVVSLSVTGHRRLSLHRARITEYADRVAAVLGGLHDASPLQTMFDRAALVVRFRYLGDDAITGYVLKTMADAGRVRLTDRGVGLADRAPHLSKNERQLLNRLIEQYREAGFQPPSVKECEQAAQKNQKAVRSLIQLAASDGDLVEVGDQLYLHAEVEARLKQVVHDAFQELPELTVSQLRERLETTRKYAIPFCAYLDRIGFTQRDGDVRRLSPTGQATV